MKSLSWIVLLLALAAPAVASFVDDFTGATLRVDYLHCGVAAEEHVAIDRLRIEGPWPGSRVRMIDPLGLGAYMVEVADPSSGRVLYSRGFSSIYGEWETTSEAASGTWRAIEEAVRVPEPRRPFQLRIRKRGADQAFVEIFARVIDPKSRHVERPALAEREVWDLEIHGDPATKVDLLILGDGYTAAEMDLFRIHARAARSALFSLDPFNSRREDFNVRALPTPARESGISRPRSGVFVDSPLGTSYNTFDSTRYILSLRDQDWRDLAAAAPYDVVLMLVNGEKYGGGGIFNLYSTAATGSAFFPYLVVHEFAHHFAALADEYYTSPVAYSKPDQIVEPWEPNVTALLDPENLKWADLVSAATPIPTPWEKAAFEEKSRSIQKTRAELRAAGAAEAELEKLFFAEKAHFTASLGDEKHAGQVGAFEGANYEAEGFFRSETDCIMFTRDNVGFCRVCARAIEAVIDLYSAGD